MFRFGLAHRVVLVLGGVCVVATAQQQNEQPAQETSDAPREVEMMLPTPQPAEPMNEANIAAALLNQSNEVNSPVTGGEQESPPETEMQLVARGIYQCKDGGRSVFVDEENRTKYRQCTEIRAPQYEQIVADGSEGQLTQPPCSGALLYQGNTYVFNDQEPCPIPENIFEQRKPIEANPEYYSPSKP